MSPDQSTSTQTPNEAPSPAEGTSLPELPTGPSTLVENQASQPAESDHGASPETVLPAQVEATEAITNPDASTAADAMLLPPTTVEIEASLSVTSSEEDSSASSPETSVPAAPVSTEPTVPPVAPTETTAAPITTPAVAPSTGVFVSGKAIVLPNGKVGEPYSFKFTPDIVDLNDCLNVRVLGPEGLGLTFDQSTQTLAGQPSTPGQHELRLSYTPANAKAGEPAHIRALQWYVNPDPRSLWTEHEPAADLVARKEHVAHQFLVEGPKAVVAASRRGRSHAKDAKFREDDFRCFYQAESNSYVLAVADGAGSATMSREGSRVACEVASEHVLSSLNGDIAAKLRQLSDAFETAEGSPETRKALQDELYKLLGNAALLAARQITQTAETSGHVARDYATTLLLALCYPTTKGWLIGAFWIGDGGLGLYRREEGIRLLGEPDGGEYSGQTRFLTMKETFEASSLYGRVRFELVPDFDALVLMTDGITDALFQTDANLAKSEKWTELLDGINSAAPLQRDNQELGEQLTEWLNFWVKGEYDDRTIAILF